jgi:hypothetical protein
MKTGVGVVRFGDERVEEVSYEIAAEYSLGGWKSAVGTLTTDARTIVRMFDAFDLVLELAHAAGEVRFDMTTWQQVGPDLATAGIVMSWDIPGTSRLN